jgi:RNA 3'-terminal phosphate cyclase (ATP)
MIDGAEGEGGGQILRTALALGAAEGRAVRVRNIRANRPRPGLAPQHLACVEAICRVSGGEAEGAATGSREVLFRPGGAVRPGAYAFDVGTAGSAGLVLQTVLPPLLLAEGPSEVTVRGGTHNPAAPPFEFLRDAFLPRLEAMGARVALTLRRHGFAPAGGGEIHAAIDPAGVLRPVSLGKRGGQVHFTATALVARLPAHIGQRECEAVARRLRIARRDCRTEIVADCDGPGNALVVDLAFRHAREVFTGFGRLKKSAEAVAADLAREAKTYLAARVPVGPYLADQLLPYLALAGGGDLKTVAPTRHARTNAAVVEALLGIGTTFRELPEGVWEVRVGAGGPGFGPKADARQPADKPGG